MADRLPRTQHPGRGTGPRRRHLAPCLVVLAATVPGVLEPLQPQLTSLTRHAPLTLAGADATPQIASAVGARLMTNDPVTEAEQTIWPQ